MFISKLECPEIGRNHCLISKCRLKKPKIHERCYVLEYKNPVVPRASLFPLFLADLDKKYRNEIEMDKKYCNLYGIYLFLDYSVQKAEEITP